MFRNVILILFFMSLFIFTNCKNTTTVATPIQVENPKQEALEFKTLVSDSQSNYTEKTEQLIRSQKELNTVFAKVNSTRMPGIPVPNVDFGQYEVFFYAPGEVNHGVDGLQVASVVREKDMVVVTMAAGKPQGKYVTMVMSQPCVMIQYKKQGIPVQVSSAVKPK